jgi:hypothetical protein
MDEYDLRVTGKERHAAGTTLASVSFGPHEHTIKVTRIVIDKIKIRTGLFD